MAGDTNVVSVVVADCPDVAVVVVVVVVVLVVLLRFCCCLFLVACCLKCARQRQTPLTFSRTRQLAHQNFRNENIG